jgi:hypothetical protein
MTPELMLTILIVVAVGVVYILIDQAYGTGKVVISNKCFDSDGGVNYYEPGYVTYKTFVYKDACIGNTLSEMHCSYNQPRTKNFICPDGCSNGRCINKNISEVCNPGSLEYNTCGDRCGIKTHVCNSQGQWNPWGACYNEGSCIPGSVESCFTYTGSNGSHVCSSKCEWGQCNIGACGNGELDADEECDGYDLNGNSCASLGNFTGGILRCNPYCKFDKSSCIVSTACISECSSAGQKECLPVGPGAYYRVCGNYDSDPCLEWSLGIACTSSQSCSNGNCVAANAACINECSPSGAKKCDGVYCSSAYNVKCKNYRVCGDYDGNKCFEWSSLKTCQGLCYNNKCIVI